jgi:hypothetical protein
VHEVLCRPAQSEGLRLGESAAPEEGGASPCASPRELLLSPQQWHGDKETSVGKKSTPEFRRRDRICHGRDDGWGKDADRNVDGPRYLL